MVIVVEVREVLVVVQEENNKRILSIIIIIISKIHDIYDISKYLLLIIKF